MPIASPAPPRWFRALAWIAIGFGVATLFAGGSVLFGTQLTGSDQARQAAGAVVPFVLWFNFAAGFAYVIAGVGLWQGRRWAAWLALGIAAATTAVGGAFLVYVAMGGAYEPRTVAALVFRAAVWTLLAGLALRHTQSRRTAPHG